MVLKRVFFLLGLSLLGACASEPKTCSDCDIPSPPPSGLELYTNLCAACHGDNGKLGVSGAKDLTKSKLSDVQIKEILNEGKGAMPAQIGLIGKPNEMDSVVQYIKKFRK